MVFRFILLLCAPLKILAEQQFKPPTLFIMGGNEAIPHSSPWLVSIRNKKYDHVCGGTLITEQWVLSAAHCFKNGEKPQDVAILLGIHYAVNLARNNPDDFEIRAVDKIITHEGYDNVTSDNDVAVLKLTKPVVFTKYIKTIPLSKENEWLRPGRKVAVSGWGKVVQGKRIDENNMYSFDGDCQIHGRQLNTAPFEYFMPCGRWYVTKNDEVILKPDALQKLVTRVANYDRCFPYPNSPRNKNSFLCTIDDSLKTGVCHVCTFIFIFTLVWKMSIINF